MNETQNVFAIFFAIFLGTVANVQPRWKAFNWPLVCLMPKGQRRRIWKRLILSFVLLSAAPVFFFAVALWRQIGPQTEPCNWTVYTVIHVVVHGVLPAFAAFAFYRLWLCIVEKWPTAFYVQTQGELPDDIRGCGNSIVEPSIKDLHIVSRASFVNMMVGAAYLVIFLLLLFLPWL